MWRFTDKLSRIQNNRHYRKEGYFMKDFINRHPFISLFALDCVVTGIVNIVTIIRTGQIPWSSDDDDGDSTDVTVTK